MSKFFLPFFRLRSDDDINCYIAECLQDAIQKERQATQEMLAERDRLAEERDRLSEERTQRLLEEKTQAILEEERARNNAQTKAIYDLFSVSYYFCIYIRQECICMFG